MFITFPKHPLSTPPTRRVGRDMIFSYKIYNLKELIYLNSKINFSHVVAMHCEFRGEM